MGLLIQDNTVPVTGRVAVHGNECNAVKMYGNEVWKKDEWEILFSGSRVFTDTGSMSLSGLNSGDTVEITATAEFIEDNGYSEYSHSRSAEREQLPVSLDVYAMASINISAASGKINFIFNDYVQSFKGEIMSYTPTKLIITEVRRK